LPIAALVISHSVSIPSRRVGDRHSSAHARFFRLVSIPSRRVGDNSIALTGIAAYQFPSPQGGSETVQWRALRSGSASFHPLKAGRRQLYRSHGHRCLSVSIPSRRVGDCSCATITPDYSTSVSIPSRRVGDQLVKGTKSASSPSFHPLKAGRRP